MEDSPNRVSLLASPTRPGWLVLRDNFFPGWGAEVDGNPAAVLRANYAFRAVSLPAGAHLVVFRYRPLSLYLGFAFSMAGLLLCAVMVITLVTAQRRLGQGVWPQS